VGGCGWVAIWLPATWGVMITLQPWFRPVTSATPTTPSPPTDRAAEDAEDAAGLTQEEYLLLTSRLHTVLRPFMLRRLKESVAGELPGKVRCALCSVRLYCD